MEVHGYLSNQEQMQPTLSVVIYSGGGETRATLNPIEDDDDGVPWLRPGDNMTVENVQDLASMLAGSSGESRKILPANVLVAEAGLVVWWTPMQRRPVFFQTGRAEFDDAANAKNALHPPLMIVGKPRSITVYALPSNERPTDATELLRAPYYNLYGHGAMCLGNVPIPDTAAVRSIPEYERAFFDSSFVHTNLGGLDLTSHPKGHDGLWLEMIQTKARAYPYQYLLPLPQGHGLMTVEKAINLK